jgi:PhnB protein
VKASPYLFFDGTCEEAFAFYESVLGGELFLMRRRDAPDQGELTPGFDDRILHASLTVGDVMLMGSDGDPARPQALGGFAVHLEVASTADAERIFTALGEGGTVKMPLGETFWSHAFGVTADRFGVTWMVDHGKPM